MPWKRIWPILMRTARREASIPSVTHATSPMRASNELQVRAVAGAVMAVAAVAGAIGGGLLFGFILVGCAIAALREWHRLVEGGTLPRELGFTAAAIVLSVLLAYSESGLIWPAMALVMGAVVAGVSAALRGGPFVWHAAGPIYIGVAPAALMALRETQLQGEWVVLGLFGAIWAADTGALFFGKFIGGPKLAPVLSPNKTWAGWIGGTLFAGAVLALYVGLLGGNAFNAGLAGVFLAVVGHGGDLFESWVKRRFRAKNTGGLIPGHGGMLDRIDSLLFAAPAGAALVFAADLNPLFGVPL